MEKIQIGKLYEVCANRIVAAVAFNEKLEVICTLEEGATFIPIESISMDDTWASESWSDFSKDNNNLVKLKILTSDGKIGYCSFWCYEIKLVKN